MKKSRKALAVAAFLASGAAAGVCGETEYFSIVRDNRGRVVEKSSGDLKTVQGSPVLRSFVVGCLFAQLQSEGILDPDRSVSEFLPGFGRLTLREAMVNSAGPRFVDEVVEPCIAKIAGKEVDAMLAERLWKPLGIGGNGLCDIREVYALFRMLADDGAAEDGTRVMSPNAVKLLRRSQVPLTVGRMLSYGARPRGNGRFIGLDSTPELDAVANPDTGECAVWLCRGMSDMKAVDGLKENVWKASRPLRTGVYVGIGPMGLSSTELVRYVARSPELDLTLVDGEDMRGGVLDRLDMLVMPGGDSRVLVGDMGTEGVAKLKDFVRRGGSYVGICAGCVILLDDEYRVANGVGMVPYSRYGAFDGDAMASMVLTDEGAAAMGMDKGRFDVWYSGGPAMFRRHDDVPDAKIDTWGVYAGNVSKDGWGARMEGKVAAFGGTYGKGRIAATACHPEFRHSADRFAEGLFRYAAGRDVTFPEPRVNPGAKKVYYYSWPVAGKECARLMTELDADPDIDLVTEERDEMCGGGLDGFDALIIPDGSDWALSIDMFPTNVEASVASYAARGGKVLSWGAGIRHLPKGGIACRSAYDVYARLKSGK